MNFIVVFNIKQYKIRITSIFSYERNIILYSSVHANFFAFYAIKVYMFYPLCYFVNNKLVKVIKMIGTLSSKMTQYIKKNSSIKTDADLEKINYALQAIMGETFKIAVLIGLFLILGKTNYLLFSMMILFTLRTFVGGYHCDTPLKCLLYSTILFLITSLIGPMLPVFNILFYYTISALSILVVAIYAPFLNKIRPIKSKKRRWIIKLLSIFVTIFWLGILLFYVNSSHYLNCGFLTIILEVIQFLLTREEYNYEK